MFQDAYFESVIAINLTSMLVLVALFVQVKIEKNHLSWWKIQFCTNMHFNILTATCNDVVNSDLPVMAYIKMMGLWLIFIQTSTIHFKIMKTTNI